MNTMTQSEASPLAVTLGDRSYPIYLGVHSLEHDFARVLDAAALRGAVGVVTDSNVGPLYAQRVLDIVAAAGLRATLHSMPAGESFKRLEQVEAICGAFLGGGLDRSSLVIALGGGVVGDVAGFAAAAFMRGIPFVQIPTTIVAQVDSSVGGKTGVNHPMGKNTIGAFHQPRAVIIDMALLETLPDRELRAGMAEVIKHGVIADAALFAHMETQSGPILNKELPSLEFPILRSCEIKSAIVAEDELEQGVRAHLNYGHTFGHAIEAVTEYRVYLHGEAIALGMCAAAGLARALGMVDAAFETRQRACLEAYGLPVHWDQLPVDATLSAMRKDKKARAGTMKFILPTGLGQVVQRTDISEADVRGALEGISSR